jgi:hypothetical protein
MLGEMNLVGDTLIGHLEVITTFAKKVEPQLVRERI